MNLFHIIKMVLFVCFFIFFYFLLNEIKLFDQEFGLKQGCVLPLTLFFILMTDLANMLEYSSIGANISSKLINCLLFADDVVLIAESPEELQELLNISNAFANKWNLKFNP